MGGKYNRPGEAKAPLTQAMDPPTLHPGGGSAWVYGLEVGPVLRPAGCPGVRMAGVGGPVLGAAGVWPGPNFPKGGSRTAHVLDLFYNLCWPAGKHCKRPATRREYGTDSFL